MLEAIKRFFLGLFGLKGEEPPVPPNDPFAYRTAPRRRGPHERGGAVAVLEPEEGDDSFMDLPKGFSDISH